MSKYSCTRWTVDISNWKPSLSQLTQALIAIQPEERERLIKFHFIDDFLSSLVGRLLMRKFVSNVSGLNYYDIQFSRDERGKPHWVLDEAALSKAASMNVVPPRISFNVSHQGDLVVLAGVVAKDPYLDGTEFGVGVDVMKIEYCGGRSLPEFFRLMHKKFSTSEWRSITRPQKNAFEQLKAFMRHWCLKEAYVKELGVGITVDLEKISFTLDKTKNLEMDAQPLKGTKLRCNDVSMNNWQFEEHLLSPKYCAAIAFRDCDPETEKFVFLEVDDIIEVSKKTIEAEVVEYCRSVLRKQRKR